MIKKSTLFLTVFSFLVIILSFAPNSTPQSSQYAPDSLYPQPGPGELLIVDQLKESNRQLQEQTRLLAEQNRILMDTLEHMKKHDAAEKAAPK